MKNNKKYALFFIILFFLIVLIVLFLNLSYELEGLNIKNPCRTYCKNNKNMCTAYCKQHCKSFYNANCKKKPVKTNPIKPNPIKKNPYPPMPRPAYLLTFDNILQNIDKIPQVAFQSAQDLIQYNVSNNIYKPIPINIHIGPTSTYLGDPTPFVERIQQLWAQNMGPSKSDYVDSVHLFIFNSADAPKTVETMKSLKFTDFTHIVMEDAKNIGSCDTFIDYLTNRVGSIYSIQPQNNYNSNTSERYWYGFNYFHEFTHAYQHYLYRNYVDLNDLRTMNQALFNFLPCWFHEGQPHVTSYYCGSDYNIDLTRNRNYAMNDIAYNYTDTQLQTKVTNLIMDQKPICYEGAGKQDSDYSLGYGIGALILEIIVSIGGFQSTMDLIQYGATNLSITFPMAFEHVYGIPWTQAVPIIVQVLQAEGKIYRSENPR